MYFKIQDGFGTGIIIRKVQCATESKQIAVSQALGPLESRAAASLAELQQNLVSPGWIQQE